MVSRRGFLKLIGGATAAVIVAPALSVPKPTAPLFIPAKNLDMGVPHRILTATEMPTAPAPEAVSWSDHSAATVRMQATVPILMLRNEFSREWGGKLMQGSTVLVDEATAARWQKVGVAVPKDATGYTMIPEPKPVFDALADQSDGQRMVAPARLASLPPWRTG